MRPLFALLLVGLAPLVGRAQPVAPVGARASVCFTPASHCADRIVQAIDAAQQQIRVQAYGFTAAPILRALALAARRGVDVQVLLDKSNVNGWRYSGAEYMWRVGIPVWIDYLPAIAHAKLIIVDRHLIVGGSYNYTASAETRNAEDVTFLDSPELAAQFLANWRSRQAVSRPYTGTEFYEPSDPPW
jgi:phosphatidylserine/phosphatidylglycerophosphate/cardiolipin synthase-like enzyme